MHSLGYLDVQGSGAGMTEAGGALIEAGGALGDDDSGSSGSSDVPANGGSASSGEGNAMAGDDRGGAGAPVGTGAAGKGATDGRAGAPSAPDATPLTNNAKYSLHPGHNLVMCADDRGRNLFNGASVIQYACNGQSGQEFVALDRGQGYFSFKNALNGRCLEVAGAKLTANAVIDLYTCSTADNQLWLVTATSGSLFKIVAKSSGMALDVQGEQSTVSDLSLVQNTYDDSLDMQWRLDLAR